MSKQPVEFWTPVGRVVSGDVFKPRDKDMDGKPLVIKNGPNAGQPRVEYYFSLAIRKDNPDLPKFWQMLDAEAKAGFPHLFGADGKCLHPQFAWKYVDGDSQVPNKKLKKPCDNEGWPGCWVFHFSSSIAPKCYHRDKAVPGAELTDPESIKRGYYVQVNGTVAANGRTDSPGLYLNPRFVLLVAYGPEIVSGPDVAQAMTSAPPVGTLPPGASTAPVASANPAPGLPGAAGVPASTPSAPATPGTTPPPAHDFLNGPGTVAAPPAATVAPPPAAKKMTGKEGGGTYEQMIAAGWTDALLIQHGHMLP